jgi:hypothetical protein
MKPQIVIEDWKGKHNSDPNTQDRLLKGNTYKDCSTICIIPTRGMIPAKVVQNWMSMLPVMNQKLIRYFCIGCEVGIAYSEAIENILANPELSKWKYILTLEEDNMPPPNGLHLLIEAIETGYDAVGGIYFCKGEGGSAMIYGDPNVMPRNFIPQVPIPNTIQPCSGLGMGFTLFKLDMFKDPNLPRPLFKTVNSYEPGKGSSCFTQDLYFFDQAISRGYKFACDTRCKVGHYEYSTDTIW